MTKVFFQLQALIKSTIKLKKIAWKFSMNRTKSHLISTNMFILSLLKNITVSFKTLFWTKMLQYSLKKWTKLLTSHWLKKNSSLLPRLITWWVMFSWHGKILKKVLSISRNSKMFLRWEMTLRPPCMGSSRWAIVSTSVRIIIRLRGALNASCS